MKRTLYTVDVGNSAIKVGRFPESAGPPGSLPRPDHVWRVCANELDAWRPELPAAHAHWAVGTVHQSAWNQLQGWLGEHRQHDTHEVLSYERFDLTLAVTAPAQLGIDRLAAAQAANRLRTGSQAALILDVGTTITCDVVSAEGVFLGGSIAPGWQMRLDAMHRGTDKLPQLRRADTAPPLLGKDTQAAMQAGAYWSLLTQIEGMVTRFRAEYGGKGLVLLTGGSAVALQHELSVPVQHEPNLVLGGLALAVS